MGFSLSNATLGALARQSGKGWARDEARRLYDCFPAYYQAFGALPDNLLTLVSDVAVWADGHDVTGKADVSRLCVIAASLGYRFWQDPRFVRLARQEMMTDTNPPSRRAEALTRRTKAWLRQLWAGDDIGRFGIRLAERIRRGAAAEPSNLLFVLPGHWQVLSADDNERLISWLCDGAPHELRQDDTQMLAYVACSLVHGFGWLNDPQFPDLAKIVMKSAERVAFADAIEAIYQKAAA